MTPLEIVQAAKEYESRFLFHGTAEPFTTKLHVGGDGILWTADSSAVAQSYIPEAGHSMYFAVREYELDRTPMRPPDKYDRAGWNLAKLAGVTFPDVEYDQYDRVRSWVVKPRDATPRMIVNVLHALGYAPNRNGVYEVKLHGDDVMPAAWRLVGRLFIIAPKKPLRLADITTGDPADMLDPEYLQYGKFKAFEAAGYDGVKVPDLLQSKVWGNFGHDSVALFRRALKKISVRSIPATNYDPPDLAGWQVPTPEFMEFFLKERGEQNPRPPEGSAVPGVGYKVVLRKGRKLFSLYDHSPIPRGGTHISPGGLYLGTTREFCLDFYASEPGDFGAEGFDGEALMAYTYRPEDVIRGDPAHPYDELLVREARVLHVTDLPSEQ